jgi:hypothetical protein
MPHSTIDDACDFKVTICRRKQGAKMTERMNVGQHNQDAKEKKLQTGNGNFLSDHRRDSQRGMAFRRTRQERVENPIVSYILS